MKILVGCEYSGAFSEILAEDGHFVVSCDLLPYEGKFYNNHIHYRQDILKFDFSKFDLILAFPPCTHLACSGARHFEQKRKDGRQKEGVKFFYDIYNKCIKSGKPFIIENPINIIGTDYNKKYFPEYDLPNYTFKSSPHLHGSYTRKNTCFWSNCLKELKPTKIQEPKTVTYTKKDGSKTTFSYDYSIKKNTSDNGHGRSKFDKDFAVAIINELYNQGVLKNV